METEGIVQFNDWQKIDLRVGKITNVEEIEGANKLYKLTVNLGEELGERTIAAGIKPYYDQEELKDKIIVVFTNLKPREIMGVKSEGMLLAAGSQKENLCVLISPEKSIELGSKIS